MKLNKFLLFALFVVFFFFGCKYSQQTNEKDSNSQSKTKITKNVLQARLEIKGIKSFPTLTASQRAQPSPFVLTVKFAKGGAIPNFTLNNQEFNFDDLQKTLNSIFVERVANFVMREGSNLFATEVFLGVSEDDIEFYNSNEIYVEDFEKLTDDLKKADITEITLDFNKRGVIGIYRTGTANITKNATDSKAPPQNVNTKTRPVDDSEEPPPLAPGSNRK